MSFPNYSSLFTLGLSSSSAGPSKPAPVPTAASKKPTGRRRSRAHSLKSFLKLDTRTEPAPPMPALPIVTPHTPVSPTHPSPKSPPAPLMCRRSRETLRSIPSPKPIPSSQTLPEPPSLGLPMPMLSPSASPASAISTLPPSTPPPPPAVRPVSECTINSYLAVEARPAAPARKSSTALGLGLTELKSKPPAMNRMSVAASSVASPRRRRVQRSAALANLEGRSSADNTRTAPLPRNFMSMSDDEDDEHHVPELRSEPVSPTLPMDKTHRSRALSDVSSVVLRADFLDFGFSPSSTMTSPSILSGDMADDGFRALDAALFAALGNATSKSQTFSSFIDVSA